MAGSDSLRLGISGLELSRRYYEEYAAPLLAANFRRDMGEITVGLAGEGSECFGFDDLLSTDHDYGPSFCIWLSAGAYSRLGAELAEMYAALPQEYLGVSFRFRREEAKWRRGVIKTEAFYAKFLGRPSPPETARDWLMIPEEYLAVATNGELFQAPDTDFVRTRNALLAFYPEDVRRKKIAANLVRMAHAGQINYSRMAQRRDSVAARLALNKFIEAAMRTAYLLRRRYCPYYKWMRRGMDALYDMAELSTLLDSLAANDVFVPANELIITAACGCIIELLHAQGLSAEDDTYLERQACAVAAGITGEEIKKLPIFMG